MHIPFAFLGQSASLTVEMPTFTPDGGTYPVGEFPLDVTIAIQAPATKFRYTINDTNIDENNGILVNGASVVVSLDNFDVLRAIAITPSNQHSRVRLAEYDHFNEGGGGGHPPIIP